MFFIEKRIENKIIDKLSEGSLLSTELISFITEKNNVTKQGVYKALSFLIENEIVTKNKKGVALSVFWIEKMKAFTEKMLENYYLKDFNDFLKLENKEKISYSFKNTDKLDVYWMHTLLILLKHLKNNRFAIYNPHCWFMLDRTETEPVFFDWINKNKKMTFYLFGENTLLDREIKKKIQSEHIKIEFDLEGRLPKDRYISIIDDYIIYSIYGENFTKDVDNFFQKNINFNNETIEAFKKEIAKNSRSKIIIEKNKIKATRLFKQITRHHYVPL